ncbi:MAG TPA: endonuclease/exonuclease/phosphatase family protein [Tepidisphaeraceae bacterium]|nr:endonuclease/exonuclease/phosphatase family protein [Tepidisphaeraceae bacterium]
MSQAAEPLRAASPAPPPVQPAVSFTGNPPASAGELRVMSFNLRVKTVLDSLGNSWTSRRDLLVATIRQFDPDLLGTQEGLATQIDYLSRQLPDYDWVGAGRGDGNRRGEMCAIFFRRSRFQLLDSGHFWLSDTPAVPGSKSWGSAWPRMVTWVKLRPRGHGRGTEFCMFNTHFDVFGARARVESARLLRSKMRLIGGNLPCIITGDFNDQPGSEPYETLLAGDGSSAKLTDVYRASNPRPRPQDEGTRHKFKGGTDGPRIDWIITNAGFQPTQAQILHANQNGKFPSDHFPVVAVLRPVAASATPVARIE